MENSLVNIYVDLPANVAQVLFLVSSKLRLFSNLVVLGNSCFSFILSPSVTNHLSQFNPENQGIGGINDDRLS